MAIGWGGFAQGLTAGSNAAAQAYRARQDAEDQAWRNEQRAEERDLKAKIKAAYAPAEVATNEGGLMVQGPEGQFTIPQADVDVGAYDYFDQKVDAEGNKLYSVAGGQGRQREVTAGGKTIGRMDYLPEHEEMGYDPAAGLQQKHNEGRNQRAREVAMAAGRPEIASAYGALETQEMQKRLTQAQIDRLPRQERAEALQLQKLEADEATRILLGHIHRAVATGDFTGAVALMDQTHPDPNGYTRELVKDPDNKEGYIFRTRDPKNGNKVVHTEKLADFDDVIGKAHSLADPSKALPWIQEKRKDTQMRATLDLMNKKLDAELARLRGAAGVSAYTLGQAQKFDKAREAIVDKLKTDIAANPEKKQELIRDATTEITMLATKYGGPGGGLAQLLKPEKAPGRDYTPAEQNQWQDVIKKVTESPAYGKLKTPAEQRDYLLSSHVPEELLPPDLRPPPIAPGPQASVRAPGVASGTSSTRVPTPRPNTPAHAELRAARADLDAANKELKSFGGVKRAGLQQGDTSLAAAQQRAAAARARVAAAQSALERSLPAEQTAPYIVPRPL